ncbi:MAG: hypothetical protein ACYC9J_11680 [Sulfuricaulis sp.]
MSKKTLTRNTVISLMVMALFMLTVYAGVQSYREVMTRTVPMVNNKVNEEYGSLISQLDIYDKSSGILTTDMKKQLTGLGSDLYVLAGGNPRFSTQVSELIRAHGEELRMLSPTYQALLFCSTYQDKCKDMLGFIIHDMSSKMLPPPTGQQDN